MKSNINIISADTTIFDDPFLWCHFNRSESEDIFLDCNAIVGPSSQHFGNAVNIKLGIPITM